MNERKIQRLRFDHLGGDTPLQRLMSWLRRRQIRNCAWLTTAVVFICAALSVPFLLSWLGDQPMDEFLEMWGTLCLLALIYLLPWVWQLVLIVRPDWHPGVRKLGKLGDLEAFVRDMEEDLAAEDGVLFQKGGVCVTRRFIIDISLFLFRVYPLEDLRGYCGTVLPVFSYKNGTSCKVDTMIPFQKLKPYINLGGVTNMDGEKPKTRKKYPIFQLIVTLVLIGMFISLNDFDVLSVWGPRVAAILFGGVILFVFAALLFSGMINTGFSRKLSGIKDLDERIRKLTELRDKGQYKNRMIYFNHLATIYYEKGDIEKALELTREAFSTPSGRWEIRLGPAMSTLEILKLNEITYLTALGRLDEAERLLSQLDENRYKSTGARYNIYTARAQLAIGKGDTATARDNLRFAGSLSLGATSEQTVNISCFLLLLEAECDLLERDAASALIKLDDITARCTWPPTLRRTGELKDTVLPPRE